MRIAVVVISTAVTLIAVAMVIRATAAMVRVIRRGQPAVGRTDHPATRWRTMLVETVGHTRLAQGDARRWRWIGVAHWFVAAGFILLVPTLVTAYGQIYAGADWALPLIGHFWPYELVLELIAVLTTVAILGLIAVRLVIRPSRRAVTSGSSRSSRFSGSRMWMAYYVEATVLAIGLAIVTLRTLEAAASDVGWDLHHPVSGPLAGLLADADRAAVVNAIFLVGGAKIVISMAWFAVIATHLTMGVAWHRFTAFPNVWFRRESDGSPALGPLQPMYSGGEPIDFDDPDEDDTFGAGRIEDFSWKGLLDFTTCTECGRCQSVCPAWATNQPLSPKQLVMDLREHAYAVAADEDGAESNRPLVGADGGVISPDVLWGCTNCGACVQECPVDIEHVDHIADMRRNQVLIASEFPGELTQLFRGLESQGNPWNAPASGRLDWTKGLPFAVPVVGRDVTDLSAVDYLFWVGCAGAFDDRGKQTTRAVAELLHLAGVSFAVLGDAETCTGDPARRTGNEFVYQMLARQNVETYRELDVAASASVVVTCAHCFNTIKNEYRQLGIELTVVHHTQLLNRLVREGRLRPAPPETGADGQWGDEPRAGHGGSTGADGATAAPVRITYHDPCFLGRHNGEYDAPRELIAGLGALDVPGSEDGATAPVEPVEMPRNSERAFCCGAGGGRMWTEDAGEATPSGRINLARTAEALATGADRIATGCPFCRIMLSDGVNALQSDATRAATASTAEPTAGSTSAPSASENGSVEVLDVAQLLLQAVRRGHNIGK